MSDNFHKRGKQMTSDGVLLEAFKILDSVLIEALNEPCNAGMAGIVKAELDHIIRSRFKFRLVEAVYGEEGMEIRKDVLG